MNGRSRSRSRERVDRFGRVIPSNRTRSRSRSRDRHRRRSRSPPPRPRRRSRTRSKSRGRSGSRSTSVKREPRGPLPTNIEDPKFLNARVFIGNLPAHLVTKEELEVIFQQHGKILGVSVHDKGFGFVQFEKEEDARRAADIEHGSRMKGNVVDVKMAAEGRRGGPRAERGGRVGGPGHDRTPYDRERPHPPPPPGGPRDRMTPPPDPYGAGDPYRDPYPRREPPGRDLPPGPPRRDDPYYGDPYRRPPPPDDYIDRYRDDPYRRPPPPDPYRREPYDDPYRDPYYRDPYGPPGPPPPPRKAIPADVQVICMNSQLRSYGESMDVRLRQSAMICEIVVIPENVLVPQMVEEASQKNCLFAVILNSQNELHKSLTLNILHGTPQEHRNMPFDDAITLIVSSFESYVKTQREKTATPAAPAAPTAAPASAAPDPDTPTFLPPSSDISYLLNLLADNRQLTLEELVKVIDYLTERKDKLLLADGRQPAPAPVSAPRAVPAVSAPASNTGDPTTSFLQQQQQELQAKILSILNGSGSSTPSVPPNAPAGIQAQSQMYGVQSAASRNPPQSNDQGGSLINFDNPNVQKALDNLIQSGPNLLKGVSASSGQTRGSYPGTAQQARPQGQAYGGQMQYQQGGMQTGGAPRMMAAGYGGQTSPRGMAPRMPQQGARPRY